MQDKKIPGFNPAKRWQAAPLGPLSSEQAAQQLIDQNQRSVDAGAKVMLGGKRIDRPGASAR